MRNQPLGIVVGLTALLIFGRAQADNNFCASEKIGSKPPIVVAINAAPEGKAIREACKTYNEVPVRLVEFSYNDLRQELLTSAASGRSKFDLVMIDDPWFPQLAPDLAPLRGVSQSLLEDIVPASLALGKDPYKTGVLKALPFVGNTQLLFIRTDLMKGNAPKTWDELIDMARQERAPQLNRYGYAIRGRAGAPVVSDFLPIYWSSGGRITDRSPSGRLTSVFDERLFQGALRTYGELRDLSPPGAINFDWPEMTSALVGGRALMQLNWPIAIPELIRPRPGSAPPKWTIALPPEVKGSATPATSMIGNWLLGIPRASTQSEAAQGFLVWLLDQQERVADEGRSPTRQSVFDVLARKKPYFAEIRTALERSTPRDRTERWSQIEEAISRAVTGYLAQPSSDEVYSRRLTTELNRILQRQ